MSNGTCTTSPTLRKKRTPRRQVTRTMSAQPTTRETEWVGCALEAGMGRRDWVG